MDGDVCKECDAGYALTGSKKVCLYSCTSNLKLGPPVAADKKGLMLDDTTHHWCPDSLHSTWANTAEPVKSIRIAKAWEGDWPGDAKEKAWDSIATYLQASGAKALVGTSLSCNETNDDQDWSDVKKLLQKIGASNVLGVAVGNELELLWNQGAKADCVTKMWSGGYVQKKFDSRVSDLDALGADWKSVKVTSVASTFIFAEPDGTKPFPDGPPFAKIPGKADVLTFYTNVLKSHGDRYAFSINNYPYFDTNNELDKGTKDQCTKAIQLSTCFDSFKCKFNNIVISMRQRMTKVGADKNNLWVTETGWSSPKAGTLIWDPAKSQNFQMANCTEFSAPATMQKYYDNFLKWDLSGSTENKTAGPDHVFFFTMRDSSNMGVAEHFGLGGSGDPTKLCVNTTCKLQTSSQQQMGVIL